MIQDNKMTLSPNTQAILLLTAPLIAGRDAASSDLLTLGEYKRLARFLREQQRQPADLLTAGAQELLKILLQHFENDRLNRLLSRGFLLSQALEHWQARAIWVVSRADDDYPKRLKAHLKDDAPPVLYGCGDSSILETGGLAVVGSRHVDNELVEYTEDIGRLAAKAHRTVVSGGARGIDQAAMRGALNAGGRVTGVLADSLERTAMNREHRNFLIDGQLALISPYDPAVGFNVGHAMQRNKLIYALSDAALVVSSDYKTGGTWAGAIEQLEKLRLVPVYVRSNGRTGEGLRSLLQKGALSWPNPETPESFVNIFSVEVAPKISVLEQNELFTSDLEAPMRMQDVTQGSQSASDAVGTKSLESHASPSEELFAKVRELLANMRTSKTDAEIAADLHVSKKQAKEWLERLAKEGVLEKLTKPVRYGIKSQHTLLN